MLGLRSVPVGTGNESSEKRLVKPGRIPVGKRSVVESVVGIVIGRVVGRVVGMIVGKMRLGTPVGKSIGSSDTRLLIKLWASPRFIPVGITVAVANEEKTDSICLMISDGMTAVPVGTANDSSENTDVNSGSNPAGRTFGRVVGRVVGMIVGNTRLGTPVGKSIGSKDTRLLIRLWASPRLIPVGIAVAVASEENTDSI